MSWRTLGLISWYLRDGHDLGWCRGRWIKRPCDKYERQSVQANSPRMKRLNQGMQRLLESRQSYRVMEDLF